MADILIKGLALPIQEEWGQELLCLTIYADGTVKNADGTKTTAIELPPHGRLVDIDKMISESRGKHLPIKIESADELADFLEMYADLDKIDHTVVVEATT